MKRIESNILFTDHPAIYRAYGFYALVPLAFGIAFAIKILSWLFRDYVSSDYAIGLAGFSTAVLWMMPVFFAGAVFEHLRLRRALYTATAFAVELREGLLDTSTKTVPLSAIKDVRISQTLWQRILGIGDMIMRDTTNSSLTFADLKDPYAKKELLWQLIIQSGAHTLLLHRD